MPPTPQTHQERVIGSLKSVIHNPRDSEEAKNSARDRLRQMGVDPDHIPSSSSHRPSQAETLRKQEEGRKSQIHQDRVEGGYKATLKNPNVSEAAKQHARDYLKKHGAL
ncbi:hypothetical protein CC2G_006694 [Coprinopsis cinerea AmutBmut pab1-1]|nr:hypothetical protein CC2G_006694 [Coprinopsis cinerea AmutBmut pab1-1]